MEEKLLRSYKRDEIVYEQTCISLNSPRKEQAFINVTRKELNAHHWMATQNKVGRNRNLNEIDRVRFRTETWDGLYSGWECHQVKTAIGNVCQSSAAPVKPSRMFMECIEYLSQHHCFSAISWNCVTSTQDLCETQSACMGFVSLSGYFILPRNV